MDAHALAAIVEDIEHIRREWYRAVKGDTLRRGSVILRRLVVEDDLGKAWRVCGFEAQPKIPAVDLEQHLDEVQIPLSSIIGAIAGGGSVEGVEFAGILAAKKSPPDQDGSTPNDPHIREFGLREFAESMAVATADGRIKRREVIKYFANVRSGAHSGLSSHARQREEELIRRVRKVEGVIMVDRFEGLYYELLSIGQAVAAAPDTERLIERIALGPSAA